MLKHFWQWYVRVPSDLDFADRLYLRGLYFMCALIALNGSFFLIAAITGDIEVLIRLALFAAAVAVIAVALALRIIFFWVHAKKSQLYRRLGLG